MSQFDKILIAVNSRGRIVVVERFPDNEKHAGMNELLNEMEDNIEVTLIPGIYWVEVEMIFDNYYHPEYETFYLDIIDGSWNKVEL